MPPPQASYVSRSSDKGYDPATLSDDDDDDTASITSRSTWASSAAEGGETTILGLTDGRISSTKEDELSNWKISRVGGQPSFPLSAAPSTSASRCLSCSRPMPLLAQVYCPLPSSSLERVIYVFSCPRPTCRRKDGAIRAWRANGLWVEGAAEEARKADEEAKRARDEADKEHKRRRAQAIDLGGLVFGGAAAGGLGAVGGAATTTGAGIANPFGTTTTSTSSAANTTASRSINPFALPAASSSSSAASSNPFATAASTSSPFNPFAAPAPAPAPALDAPPAATATAASNPFAAAPSSAAPPPDTSSAALALEPITSSWSWSSSSSSEAEVLPAYPAWYISTMYEPAGAPTSSGAPKGKGRARDADLAALTSSMTLGDGDGALEGVDEDDEDDERARPGKGAGGRTKKGAAGGQGRKDGSGRTKGSAAPSAGAAAGGGGWEGEGYEVQKVKGVDEVFLRFQERVQREGKQVVRYEFAACPVPYTASSTAYRLAYPPSSSLATAPGAAGSVAPSVGTYNPSRLPRCRSCGGATAFEAQLMPHLVGLVNGAPGAKEGEAQDWATVWVLSCVAECEGGAEGGGEGESWREERVLVEWEEEAV
ncbi:hypothetical protein JCM8208_000515 [Rhodotorula glutinis]